MEQQTGTYSIGKCVRYYLFATKFSPPDLDAALALVIEHKAELTKIREIVDKAKGQGVTDGGKLVSPCRCSFQARRSR